MAIIENANTPEAVAAWTASLQGMNRTELMCQQICQRGAEHALAELQKLGVTPDNCQAMLDSLRHALITIHEVAHARGLELLSYDL
jgi:hypothetical protein